MRAAHTLLAWQPGDRAGRGIPARGIAIGPLLDPEDPDWACPYEATGGAAYVNRRRLAGLAAEHAVLADWRMLVFDYGLLPYIVHAAFLPIDEYQALIKRIGFGPDRGERGHDPDFGFGRAVRSPLPPIRTGSALHVWPA